MLTINAAAQPRYTIATAKPRRIRNLPILHLADRPDERVEQQRDQRGDEEEEDDVKDAARDHPRQDQQERKPDQLHPARDLDLRRRAGGHRGHRTAARRTASAPAPWDWALDDGRRAGA